MASNYVQEPRTKPYFFFFLLQVAQLKRQLQGLRGGQSTAEDTLSGLRKEKDRLDEELKKSETQVKKGEEKT